MLTVTQEQKDKFKSICNFKFDGEISFIIINILKRNTDTVKMLLDNSISFNYIGDNDCFIETVPYGWKTNGSYKNCETIYTDPTVASLNIGLVIDDILDVSGVMYKLQQTMGYLAYMHNIRLVMDDTVQINHSKYDNMIFKKVDKSNIIDITFSYFRALFS